MALSQKDIDNLKTQLQEEFVNKDDLAKLEHKVISRLDSIMHYVSTSSDEIVVTQSKVNDHESRLSKVESHLGLPSVN